MHSLKAESDLPGHHDVLRARIIWDAEREERKGRSQTDRWGTDPCHTYNVAEGDDRFCHYSTTPGLWTAGANGMSSHLVDPIADPRWSQFIERDHRAGLFHTPGWVLALRQTYGYEPVVVTTSPASEPLENGVVFCRIKSWFTGSRLVSLPFSDHCEPLVNASQDMGDFVDIATINQLRYVELRPLDAAPAIKPKKTSFREAETFWFHRLDLTPSLGEIFHRFHRDCVRRKIRKAERESVLCLEGNTPELLENFYRLLLRTRRRQQLPPQPKAWFRNLAKCLADNIKIRVAYKNEQPIASILTFSHKNKMMYKYGCSDERYHRFGGMQLLLWMAIQEAKEKNYEEFDLGRCELANSGLQVFKDRFGARRSKLTYWRYQTNKVSSDRELQVAKKFFRLCPPSFLQVAGRSFYRHIG
jgi:CelD/BcsL family acetyltransferase involved in cellulose biosynthesis